jgi:hypothetical protein
MVAVRLDCRYAVPTFGDYFKRFQSAFPVGNFDRAESAGQRFKSARRLHCIFIPPSSRFIDFRQVTRSTSPALTLLHRKMGFDRVVHTAATELLFNLSTVSVKPVSAQETDSAPAHGWFLKLQADAHILILRTGGDSCKLPKPRGLAGVVSAAGMERHVPS